MLVVGVAAAAACLIALTWAKAPAASAQEESENEPSFVVRCDFSHRNSDDPIVHPGEPGAAHSHDFFGNKSTYASSSYDILRAADTTCSRTADKASYWIPTVKWGGQDPHRLPRRLLLPGGRQGSQGDQGPRPA